MSLDFSKIVFDYDKHSYTYEGVELVPATTVLKTVKPQFDAEAGAAAKALKEGGTQQEWLDEWDERGEIALEKGKLVHSFVEDVLNNVIDPIKIAANPVLPEMKAFSNAWKGLQTLGASVFKIEYKVCDIDLCVAGMIDAMLEFTTEPKSIFDWKTGKYETSSPFGPMFAPFDDLDDCQHSHYSVQTSLYRYIFEKNTGENLGDSYLVHLNKRGGHQIHRGYDLRDRIEPWFAGKTAIDMCGDPQSERQAKDLANTIGLFAGEQRRLTSGAKKSLRAVIKELIKSIS